MTNRLQLLLQMLDASPGDAFTLFAVAKEYEKAGDRAQALHFYLRLRETNAAYVGLYYHLGKLYEKMEQLEQALQVYREGMAVARQAGDAHALAELNGARLEIDEEEG